MTIRYRDRTFTSFQEYIERSEQEKASAAALVSQYAHPVDGWIIAALNATPVKAVIDKALDAVVSFQFGHGLANGIVIDQQSFPDLFDVLAHCAKTLNIPIPHAIAQHSEGALFNAFTSGTDEYAFISLSSTLCQVFPKEEVQFVIGHECGHVAASHVTYHTLAEVLAGTLTVQLGPAARQLLGPVGQILLSTAGLPLFAWSRRSEVTADRAGLLCCGDIRVAERALLRLVAGFAGVDHVEIEDYLRTTRSGEEFHRLAKIQQIFDSHPLIPKRIQALRIFADSEVYYALSGQPRPAGKTLLPREEVNRRVSQIIRP